jgi:amino acid permease
MTLDATRFVDPALGFAMGWTYWCKYAVVTYRLASITNLICIDPTSIQTFTMSC